MNAFQFIPLQQKSFLQRLFRQEPASNAIIEVNNILAKGSISEAQLSAIERKYQISIPETFPLNLEEFYAVRWNDWLKNGRSNTSIEQELNEMAQVFKLNNTDQLIQMVAEVWYRLKMDQILKKKQVTNQDEKELQLIQEHVRLKPATAQKLFDQAREDILQSAATTFIIRERLSPGDEAVINNLAFDLHISAKATLHKLSHYKYYWQLENLPLQPIVSSGQLQKSELCYFEAGQVKWLETRSAGRGYSQLEQVNYGTLYLTNKRLVFEGNIKNSTLPYDRILTISRHNNGILIQKDKGKDPVVQLPMEMTSFRIIFERLKKNNRN